MMNNKLPPSYGAIEDNVPPPKNEEISGEGPSNETTIEMPSRKAPSRNENQQMQFELPPCEVPIVDYFIMGFCFFLWLFFSIDFFLWIGRIYICLFLASIKRALDARFNFEMPGFKI